MPYVPLDRFLLRAPLLPWSDDRKAGKRLLRDPLGPLALAHASPNLAAHPEGEAAERAIARYGRRASFRPTPAGLLAGVAVGGLGTRTTAATRTPRSPSAKTPRRSARPSRTLASSASWKSRTGGAAGARCARSSTMMLMLMLTTTTTPATISV